MLPRHISGTFCVHAPVSTKQIQTCLHDGPWVWNVRPCYLTWLTNWCWKEEWDFSENDMICRLARWEWVKRTIDRWRLFRKLFALNLFRDRTDSFSFSKRETCYIHTKLMWILLEMSGANVYLHGDVVRLVISTPFIT